MILGVYAPRKICLFTNHERGSSIRFQPMRRSVSWRILGQEFLLLGTISNTHFRTTFFSRKFARYKRMSRAHREKLYHLGFAPRSSARLSHMRMSIAIGASIATTQNFSLKKPKRSMRMTLLSTMNLMKRSTSSIPQPSNCVLRCFHGLGLERNERH